MSHNDAPLRQTHHLPRKDTQDPDAPLGPQPVQRARFVNGEGDRKTVPESLTRVPC